jgi:hypothetical protein
MSKRNSDPAAPDALTQWEDGMRQEADAQGGVVATQLSPYFEDDKRLVRLPDVKPGTGPDGTEALLNGLIEDCRFLIHEVAFHSARLTPDAQHRLQFLASAQTLAVTGAKVARTIAQLRRNTPPEPEESRYRMIIEHVKPQRSVKKRGEGEGRRKVR